MIKEKLKKRKRYEMISLDFMQTHVIPIIINKEVGIWLDAGCKYIKLINIRSGDGI